MSEQDIASITSIEGLLAVADIDDINTLVNYLTDNGEGRLTLSKESCNRLINASIARSYTASDFELIAKEIQLFGGNSLLNLVRSKGVSYEEIVRDVAKHLKVNFNSTDPIAEIEGDILRKILARAFDQMSEVERKEILEGLGGSYSFGPAATAALIALAKQGGFKTFQIATIVANAVAKAILGKGLTFAVNGSIMRSISVAIGPIGWAITAIWTAADIASPAYRVTLPCTVQLAYIRQKAIMAQTSKSCSSCGVQNQREAKFCSECGEAA